MVRQIRSIGGIVLALAAVVSAPAFAQDAAPDAKTLPSIVQIAAGNPDFSILVTALTDTGLVKTLEGKGPFTVFAPTNEAFAKIPGGLVAYLVTNPSVFKSVLLYHVAAGTDSLSDTTIKTVEGDKLFPTVSFKTNGETVVKVNNSTVTAKPILASNGVIYVIDSVLLPQF